MKFGIFLFDGVEPIDIATIGVLSMAKRLSDKIDYVVFAPKAGVVTLANDLKVVADYGYDDLPAVDIIVITGGATWPQQSKDEATMAFFRQRASNTTLSSVCTGGFLLAHAGVLDGKQATTRCEGVPNELLPIERMAQNFPEIKVVKKAIVDEGTVVTGGGVCLCIDMMLHLISSRVSAELATDLARLLEYGRAWEANKQALGEYIA
ncbi:MAG: DJ-1/PfpI family protein [Burkholderiales bacterium]|nr:DJ-1/PfpI family protein [Burkholderiales bacterium]